MEPIDQSHSIQAIRPATDVAVIVVGAELLGATAVRATTTFVVRDGQVVAAHAAEV